MAGKPIATIGSIHMCPMCSGTVPHVGGPISVASMLGATINGQPIAVVGDMCTCIGPPDSIVQGCAGATINGLPIATVGCMTAHGGSIVQGVPGATLGPATPTPNFTMPLKEIPFPNIRIRDHIGATITGNHDSLNIAIENMAQIGHEALDETEEESEIIFESDYAMLQIQEFAKQFSNVTFYMFISNFFGTEIPISAYKKLYDALSKEENINPKIKVIKYNSGGSFFRDVVLKDDTCYEINSVEIRVGERLITKAIHGETEDIKNDALAKLFKIVLEEYGHYIDYLLRFEYSTVKDDALDDEGAEIMHLMIEELKEKRDDKKHHTNQGSYSHNKLSTAKDYFLTTYNPLEDDKIEFGKVTIDGVEHLLSLDFTEIQKTMTDETERIKADIKTENEEFFSAGEGNPEIRYYGHLGIEKILNNKCNISREELSHIYLGNYMRDMNQIISPLFTYLTDKEKDTLDDLEKGLYSFEWLDSIKLSRESLCRTVEILAAGQMMKIVGPKKITKAVSGLGSDLINAVSAPQGAASNFSVQKMIEGIFQKYSLKAIQMGLDYRLFIKHYGEITIEELGVYRPFEHLDNPLYAVVFDNKKNEAYFCPPSETAPLSSYYGCKQYLHNETDGSEIHFSTLGKGTGTYAGGKLKTALSYIEDELRVFYNKYEKAETFDEQNRALRHFGNALHPMEDFFAHTNFVELSLIKKGIDVYPWVDIEIEQLRNYNKSNKRFEVENSSNLDVKKYPKHLFNNKEEIEKAYSNEFNELNRDAINGFYFSSVLDKKSDDKTVFIAHKLNDTQWEVEPVINTYLNNKDRDYVRHIPLVSGYFSQYDTISSLIQMLDKIIKPKKISLKGALMDNNGISGISWEKYAIDCGDLIILNILTDLKLSQKERNKEGKETGLDYANILDYYVTLIEYRQIIISILAALKKGNPWVIIATEISVRLINCAQTAITNMVKKILLDGFDLLSKSISASQNMELHRKIGTDPSHSQLSKDSHNHPLHYLAAMQAQEAVKGIGKLVGKYLRQKDKTLKGSLVSVEEIVTTAKSYFKHPAQSNWADAVTDKWLIASDQEIDNLKEIETKRQEMHLLGENIKYSAEQIWELYNKTIEYGKEFISIVEYQLERLSSAIEQLKLLSEEIIESSINEFKRIITQLNSDYQSLKQKLSTDLYLKQIRYTKEYEKAKEKAEINLKQFESKLNKSLEEIMDLLEEDMDNSLDYLNELQNKLNKYYKELFSSLQNPSTFESQFYAFAKEEKLLDAEQIDYYYKAQKEQYKFTKQS